MAYRIIIFINNTIIAIVSTRNTFFIWTYIKTRIAILAFGFICFVVVWTKPFFAIIRTFKALKIIYLDIICLAFTKIIFCTIFRTNIASSSFNIIRSASCTFSFFILIKFFFAFVANLFCIIFIVMTFLTTIYITLLAISRNS